MEEVRRFERMLAAEGALVLKFFPQREILVLQPRRFRTGDHGIAGQAGPKFELIFFHEILYFSRVGPRRCQRKIALEVVESIERIVQLVVVKQREPIMDVGGFGGARR